MQHTSIEWVFNADGTRPGYSVNPMTGCLNQVEGMCQGGGFPCYAYKQSHGRCHKADMAGYTIDGFPHNDDSFFPRFHRQRFEALLHAPRNAGIFVCDRADIAAGYWPDWCQNNILNAARERPDTRQYWLTKQPQNLPKFSPFSPFPDNVWVGVTVCNDSMLSPAIKALKDIEAKVKFISYEPLLGRMELAYWNGVYLKDAGINWVIIGALTSKSRKELLALPYADEKRVVKSGKLWTLQPEIAWVEEIVEAADRAGCAVFLKDNLAEHLFTQSHDSHFWKVSKDSKSGTLRQEMPAI